MTNDSRSVGRLVYLDALRGLASLTVIIHHYCMAYGDPYFGSFLFRYTPLNIWRDGPAAVSLFFVLSGFVLARNFTGAPGHASPPSLKDWIITRSARIWLPYLAIFVFSVSLHPFGFHSFVTTPPMQPQLLADNWDRPLSCLDLLKQAVLPYPYLKKIVPQAWTLQVELGVSLLVPPAAMLARRELGWFVLGVVVLVGALFASPYLVHFAAGIILASVPAVQSWFSVRRVLVWPLMLAGICFYSCRNWLPGNWYDGDASRASWYFTGLGATAILLGVLVSVPVQAVLSRKPLVWLGKVSYSVYLIHWAALACVSPFYVLLANKLAPDHALFAWWSGLVATTGTVLLLSAVTHRLLELPAIALGKSLRSRLKAVEKI